MRIIHKSPILSTMYHGFISYPAPSNITYFWNFGIYSLVCLAVQIITGVALAMHYAPEVNLAFFSVSILCVMLTTVGCYVIYMLMVLLCFL